MFNSGVLDYETDSKVAINHTGYVGWQGSPTVADSEVPATSLAEQKPASTVEFHIAIQPSQEHLQLALECLAPIFKKNATKFKILVINDQFHSDVVPAGTHGKEVCFSVEYLPLGNAYEHSPANLKHLLLQCWSALKKAGISGVGYTHPSRTDTPVAADFVTPFSYTQPLPGQADPFASERITAADLLRYDLSLEDTRKMQQERIAAVKRSVENSANILEIVLNDLRNRLEQDDEKEAEITDTMADPKVIFTNNSAVMTYLQQYGVAENELGRLTAKFPKKMQRLYHDICDYLHDRRTLYHSVAAASTEARVWSWLGNNKLFTLVVLALMATISVAFPPFTLLGLIPLIAVAVSPKLRTWVQAHPYLASLSIIAIGLTIMTGPILLGLGLVAKLKTIPLFVDIVNFLSKSAMGEAASAVAAFTTSLWTGIGALAGLIFGGNKLIAHCRSKPAKVTVEDTEIGLPRSATEMRSFHASPSKVGASPWSSVTLVRPVVAAGSTMPAPNATGGRLSFSSSGGIGGSGGEVTTTTPLMTPSGSNASQGSAYGTTTLTMESGN